MARAVLGREGVNPAEQSAELWRAAVADRGDRLIDALASPVLAQAAQIAGSCKSPIEALAAYEKVVKQAGEANLTLEIGRRALVRAVVQKGGPGAFAAELFADVAGYYVARDLSSIVGQSGRVETTARGIAVKEEIRAIARAAAQAELPMAADAVLWRQHVSEVVRNLQIRVRPTGRRT
jgi:hypothetical protein